ncbi:MAG: hypothetical protein KDC28_02860 [Saprospiraceae bacterium]|nr:hypothetical protein [Saprospiraceae bacterium]MCB9321158.1 hypothetical protein [Lewinellaceae bacterium]
MEFSAVTPGSILITIVYTILLFWGVWVGVQQIYQGFRRPQQLLNPLFGNRLAIIIFTAHIIVVTLDLFVCGPLALHYKSKLWYWGGRIALLTASLPLAAYFNRNPQSFGKLIGTWVRLRNYFEITLHVVVAAIAVNWFYYYGLLYWLVAYRYLDVGPRRLIQSLYDTPEKLARRPWAPTLNWAVIVAIYILSGLAIYYQQVIYAAPPAAGMTEHTGQPFEWGIVIALNVGILMLFLTLVRKYTGPGPAAELVSE